MTEPEWTNPYAELQQSVRTALRDELRRTNGTVTREEFLACAQPDRIEKAEKLMLRLTKALDDGRLEWKADLVNRDLLIQKVGGSTAVRQRELVRLFRRSRDLSLRTAHPSLAPVSNKSQLVSVRSFSGVPVLGLDILVRPPATFSGQDGETHNDLVLGAESLVLVVHGGFVDGRLDQDEEYSVRLVVGDDLAIPKVEPLIPAAAGRCELAMVEPLLAGDPVGAVRKVLPHLASFAHEVANSFVA